jgi:hypothetical protein
VQEEYRSTLRTSTYVYNLLFYKCNITLCLASNTYNVFALQDSLRATVDASIRGSA